MKRHRSGWRRLTQNSIHLVSPYMKMNLMPNTACCDCCGDGVFAWV